jgi:hypothetical protein
VPSSIDPTGSKDVHEALQKVIDNAPNGSTIVFKAGATYRLDGALRINNRRNLTIDGNGARLNLPTQDQGFDSIGIHVRDGSVGTTIRDLTLVGNNSRAGTGDAYYGPRENNHGIAVLAAHDTLIENVEIRRVWGDCLYLNSSNVSTAWPDGVTFRDSTCRLTGRHGVGLISGSNVRLLNNTFDDISFDVVDIEPLATHEGARDVLIRGNDIGSYGLTDRWDGWLLAACGAKLASTIEGVTVTGNTVAGNIAGWSGVTKALNIKICGDNGRIRKDFTVTNNTAGKAVAGPVMHFRGVRGVTVTDNEQPLTRGELATFTGSTNVTYDG